MNIYEEIQILLLRKRLSMRQLAIKMNDAGFKMPKQSGLSNKFNKNTIRFSEVHDILDFLGYELVIQEKRK